MILWSLVQGSDTNQVSEVYDDLMPTGGFATDNWDIKPRAAGNVPVWWGSMTYIGGYLHATYNNPGKPLNYIAMGVTTAQTINSGVQEIWTGCFTQSGRQVDKVTCSTSVFGSACGVGIAVLGYLQVGARQEVSLK